MATQFVCTLLLAWVVHHLALVASGHGGFNYNKSDTTYGPFGWSKTYPEYCNGSSQSPINIDTKNTIYDSSLSAFRFNGFQNIPDGATFTATNSGHSFKVLFTPNIFEVSGGGLPGTFSVHNVHFHWGSDSSMGSEHKFDDKHYSAEMHIVTVNTKYANISEALKHPDGIAVLGVLLKEGDENPALTSFLKYTANVTTPFSPDIENITLNSTLASLIPTSNTEFYRYNGSLTTPVCAEVVTWTVFKDLANISTAQLNMLRSLKGSDNTTYLLNTFRPIQPLNSRVVKRSFETTPTETATPTGTTPTSINDVASHVANTMAIILSVIVAKVMILFGTF